MPTGPRRAPSSCSLPEFDMKKGRKLRSFRAFVSTFIRAQRIRSRLIRIGVLCALFSISFGAWGCKTVIPTTESQESQVNPVGSTRIEPMRMTWLFRRVR